MCLGRLKAGQPPACARACPTGAIRITLVETSELKKNPRDFVNIPDAPASDYTFPSTRYKTKRQWPADMSSSDYLNVKPEHSHLPLVVMLILTQLSVGTLLAQVILKKWMGLTPTADIHRWVALATGLVALAASVFHLGRPLYAFRAVLGLKTSWLSREILAFGVFAFLAVLYVFKSSFDVTVVFLSGLIGVLCSVMVYRDTKRPFWDTNMTTIKFLLTMGLLGLSVSFVLSLIYKIGRAHV